MLNEIVAVAWKDLLLLLKDKGALAVMFLLPLVLAPVMAAPTLTAREMQGTTPDGEPAFTAQAYLVNEDTGAFGRQVAAALGELPMLDLEPTDSVAEADQGVADGDRAVAIVIPAGFTANIEAHEPSTVRLITDPTQEHLASFVAGIVNQALSEVSVLGEIQHGIRAVLDGSGMLDGAEPELRQAAEAQSLGVVWTQVEQMRQNPVIDVKSETLEGVETGDDWEPFAFFFPGSAVMFAFFLVTVIAPALLREKEEGTFRRLLASPMRHSSVIGGTLLAYSLVVFMQVILLFAVGAVAFKMSLGDSPVALVVTTLFTAIAAASLGLLVGAVAKTSKQADTIGMILGFVLAALGGSILPLYDAEGFMGILSNLTPHAHALQAYRGVMVHGSGMLEVLPHITILAVFAAAFFGIAVWRFRFD